MQNVKYLEENSEFAKVADSADPIEFNKNKIFTIMFWPIESDDILQGWKSTLIDNATGDEVGSIAYSYSPNLAAVKNDLLYHHAENLVDYGFDGFNIHEDMDKLRQETQNAAFSLFQQTSKLLKNDYFKLNINQKFNTDVQYALDRLLEACLACTKENEK